MFGTNVYLILVLIILPLITVGSSCDRSCAIPNKVPYPFGFSQDCEIRLNCSNGRMQIGEFQVNLTGDSLLVNLPPKCNRPIQDIKPLFHQNYALPWGRNALLLQNCSSPPQGCVIPKTLLDSQFRVNGCEQPYCYSRENHNGSGFMNFSDLEKSTCGLFYSSIAVDRANSNSMVSLDFQTLNLGWWLEGDCNCSSNAICTKIVSPFNGRQGFHCRCPNGFQGDGFQAGNGCHQGKDATNVRKKRTKVAIALSIAGVGVISAILISIYILTTKVKNSMLPWKKKSETTINFEAFLKNHGALALKRYKFKEVRIMTNSFKNKLGQGGYGSVFKGTLNDGSLVAVKVLSEIEGNGEEFINEVASISRTSHVNIVSLLGYCFEGSKRALLYEFMPNGSLEKFIYDDQKVEAFSHMGWETLYQIAIGIARGLEYLHRGCNTRILHFDIKPHNILLDQDFCPKITDFGLAKLCPRKESTISMLGARGTVGYIAPEVFSRKFGSVSPKSDVYSYGMMILEMVGGRKNVDVGVDHTSEVYFPSWIYQRIELDENAGLYAEEVNTKKMILVGLWCIQTNPLDRPSMSKVLEMLEGSLEVLSIPPNPCLSSSPRVAGDSSTF